ncbi:peptidase T [Paucilactobacillus suebicus]|uniref:Peptidase T n=1 Tax=Paucilactobacillus suebicus DSM 5007 = KCTC 3549 TaxID=1423807 RepID=A0A0R1W2M8_9LACO|nr:peptidase T [Paucilactobacillus suebicus DSM 5007 = KCTC 3549]
MRKYENLLPRFISYAKTETRSDENSKTIPSVETETEFAKQLVSELNDLNLKNARIHPTNGYVLATIPSNINNEVPSIGFIAHIDTADFNAHNIQPQIVENYDGKSDIKLDRDGKYVLTISDFPALKKYNGQTLITTNGETLLGADDKSGVAEIMSMAEYLQNHPEVKHGKIQVGFGPDEEIGTGADHFDVADFDADFAYTVDGGPLGELEYETFNAAQATISIQGKDVHTATAKGVMVNALQLAIDINNQLPENDRPELTEGREGFYHLDHLTGTVDHAEMNYIIRDHDQHIFNQRKANLKNIINQMNSNYDIPRITLNMHDQYYNMREVIENHMDVVEIAKQAMKQLGISPVIYPVRGGTDGSKISFLGLPTPNLFAGPENMHSRYEFVSLQVMEQAVDVLLEIIGINSNQ